MELNGFIYKLPIEFRRLILAFALVLSIGFMSGLLFVSETTSGSPQGIQEQYLGNEDDEKASVMKFKKSEREMLTLIHNHVLSMALIFFLVGALLGICKLDRKWKLFLMLEPFLSVILTFGGLYGLWKGILWMQYVIIVSGALMALTFAISILIIVLQSLKKQNIPVL